jgi:hypothetical protein
MFDPAAVARMRLGVHSNETAKDRCRRSRETARRPQLALRSHVGEGDWTMTAAGVY